MNWIILTTIVLALASPFNVGIANSISAGTVAAQFDKLLIQEEQQEIQAVFTATPTIGTAPVTVQFDASTSIGDNLTYEWDFGDGTTGTGQQVEHNYEFAGAFQVALRVSKDNKVSVTHQKITAKPILNIGPPQHTSDYNDIQQVKAMLNWHTKKVILELGVNKLLNYTQALDIFGISDISPNRSWVLYAERIFDTRGMPIQLPKKNVLININSGERFEFDNKPNGIPIVAEPYISDDGSLIAFSSHWDNLYIMSKTSPIPTLLFNPNLDGHDILDVTFSPDNSEVAFVLAYSGGFQGGEDTNPSYPKKSASYVIRVATNRTNTSLADVTIVQEFDENELTIDGLVWFDNDLMILTSKNRLAGLSDSADIQTLQTDEESVTVTQTLGPDGGSIVVDFMGQPREVRFAPGALLSEVPIKVTATTKVDTTYPDYGGINYWDYPESFDYISPRIIVELPSKKLDWQSKGEYEYKPLIGLSPSFDKDLNPSDVSTLAEIRIRTNSDELYQIAHSYNFRNSFAVVTATDFQVIDKLGGMPNQTIISVQIIDLTKIVNPASDSGSLNVLSVNEPPSVYNEEEVFKLPNDRLTQIPGDLNASAWNALFYDNGYSPVDEDSLKNDYELIQEYYVPKKIIEIVFEFNATIGQVNTILRDLDADILIVLPGRSDIPEIGGLTLLLRVNISKSFKQLELIVEELNNNPIIYDAYPIYFDGPLNYLPTLINSLTWANNPNSFNGTT